MATHCFEILLQEKFPKSLPEVIIVYGDDGFLRRECSARILKHAGVDSEMTRTFDGEECAWIDVHDELATLSLFAENERRVATVIAADKLVKDARAQIEKWCTKPAPDSLLVLQVNTLPANTKLFKTADKNGWCVQCSLPTTSPRSKTPDLKKLKEWITTWSNRELGLKLTATQANQVLDAVGSDCGLLHQELSKLALYTDGNGKISNESMRQNMGT
ncbi:MAG: DNA polymerase III subunit delta, partial [Planctomycetota bacterium]